MKNHRIKSGSTADILFNHYGDGGETLPGIGSRRAEPNLGQRFKEGGSVNSGQMNLEDRLKASGVTSARGGEMEKEGRRRAAGGCMPKKRAMGGDIGTNTGSSIARRPGDDAIGDGSNLIKRARGGAAKTRRNYPMT